MQIHVGEDPFRLWIRREENYEVTLAVRFEAEHGRAVLSLRVPGREEPAPTSHYEEEGLPLEGVRGGRFIHVLPGGNRRSYALSRLTAEWIGKLPTDRWIELEPMTEFGFRYLVFPDKLPIGETKAAATAAAAPATVAPAPPPARPSVPRPAPVAKTGASGRARAPSSSTAPTRPPRQTPVAPELAHEALSQLSHPAAIQHLKMEMAKVEALHHRVDELERKLAASQSRERDLLEVLQKWQTME